MIPKALTDYAEERISKLCIDCGSALENVRDLHELVMSQVERPLIESVLRSLGGNQVKTAKVLGINRNTLRKRMSQYNLADRSDWL